MALLSPSNSRGFPLPHQFLRASKSTLPCRFPSSVQCARSYGLSSAMVTRESSDWALLVSGQCKLFDAELAREGNNIMRKAAKWSYMSEFIVGDGWDLEHIQDYTSSRQVTKNLYTKFTIRAMFWGPKRTVKVTDTNLSLGDFLLKGSGSEQTLGNSLGPTKISVSVISSISEVSSRDWDECAMDSCSPAKLNPFIMHGFLSSLEESNCSVKETGWSPTHIIAKDEFSNVLGVVPLYLKSHSLGEYVFDHSWADAYYSYGSRYYPKLQSCVPFSPVTGPRILVRNTSYRDEILDILISALKELTVKFQVSSVHVTFPSRMEANTLKEKGFLQRIGMQYHWKNRNYKNFDEFLMDLKQNKRKNIRQERKKISVQNLTMKRLRGHEIKSEHWDTFYKFYRNTTDNKWGTAYLTRDFFHNMASKMEEKVLLVIAEEHDEPIAGALNLIGGDTLYGRLWGCLPDSYYPSLHFEACYYQAIEAAIELNLDKVEAGAQGEHKIHRGYLPVATYSGHYIVDEDFRGAIQDFLTRESAQVKLAMRLLNDAGPYKDDIHTNWNFDA